jgi:hypothetical protein
MAIITDPEQFIRQFQSFNPKARCYCYFTDFTLRTWIKSLKQTVTSEELSCGSSISQSANFPEFPAASALSAFITWTTATLVWGLKD